MQIIPFQTWGKLTAPSFAGRLRRWHWRLRHGAILPIMGAGADWTPIKAKRLTASGAAGSRFFAGVLVESGAAAGVLDIHDATGATNLLFRIKVDVANTSRLFPMPGMVVLNTDAYAALDANIASVTLLYG